RDIVLNGVIRRVFVWVRDSRGLLIRGVDSHFAHGVVQLCSQAIGTGVIENHAMAAQVDHLLVLVFDKQRVFLRVTHELLSELNAAMAATDKVGSGQLRLVVTNARELQSVEPCSRRHGGQFWLLRNFLSRYAAGHVLSGPVDFFIEVIVLGSFGQIAPIESLVIPLPVIQGFLVVFGGLIDKAYQRAGTSGVVVAGEALLDPVADVVPAFIKVGNLTNADDLVEEVQRVPDFCVALAVVTGCGTDENIDMAANFFNRLLIVRGVVRAQGLDAGIVVTETGATQSVRSTVG